MSTFETLSSSYSHVCSNSKCVISSCNVVVDDQGSNSRVNEDAKFLMSQAPLQIDLKSKDEKVCEKKE